MHVWSTCPRLSNRPHRYWDGRRCKKPFLSGSVTSFLPFSGAQRVSCVLEYVVHLSGRTAQTMHSPCCNINREAILRSEWMQYQHVVPVCDVVSPVSLQWWHFRGHDQYFQSNSSRPSHFVGYLVCFMFRTPSNDSIAKASVLFITSNGWMITNNGLGSKQPCVF